MEELLDVTCTGVDGKDEGWLARLFEADLKDYSLGIGFTELLLLLYSIKLLDAMLLLFTFDEE